MPNKINVTGGVRRGFEGLKLPVEVSINHPSLSSEAAVEDPLHADLSHDFAAARSGEISVLCEDFHELLAHSLVPRCREFNPLNVETERHRDSRKTDSFARFQRNRWSQPG